MTPKWTNNLGHWVECSH